VTILCEPEATAASLLAPFLGDDVRIVVSLRAATRALAADPAERLVVIGSGVRVENALEFAAHVSRSAAGTDIVLMRDTVDSDLLSRAFDAGIQTVLPTHERHALAEACTRLAASRRPAAAPPQPGPTAAPNGVIVAVVAAKGGCGKTTFAINLARALTAGGEVRVCLVDLDLEFGDVASSLRLDVERTLLDAVPGRALTRADIAALVTTYHPGLDCILAPVGPGEAERVTPAVAREALNALAQLYDYIVVDTPARMSHHVLAALDTADHHVLITVPEVPAVKSLRRTLDVLDLLGYRRESRSIVVNRTDPRVVLTARNVETLARSPIAGHIPFSWDVPASINHAAPLVTAEPDHPVSKAIRAFARARIGTGAAATRRPGVPRRSVRGWSR
jgi:pilus assembly protein CpaE